MSSELQNSFEFSLNKFSMLKTYRRFLDKHTVIKLSIFTKTLTTF